MKECSARPKLSGPVEPSGLARAELCSRFRFVAGSHRDTQWYRAQSFGGSDKYSDESMPTAPDPERDPDRG